MVLPKDASLVFRGESFGRGEARSIPKPGPDLSEKQSSNNYSKAKEEGAKLEMWWGLHFVRNQELKIWIESRIKSNIIRGYRFCIIFPTTSNR